MFKMVQMLRDFILLGIGALFGLGAALMSTAAPLYFPNAPSWVWHSLFWRGITLIALMVADSVILLLLGGRFINLGPAILANISIFALASAIIWQSSSRMPSAELKQTSHIAVECRSEMLPKTFAPTETVRALQLFPMRPENGGGFLPTFFSFSGKEWQWPAPVTAIGPLLEGYRCEITNYDAVPIFDFLMLLDLTFFEAVDVPDQSNSKRQGSVKLRRDWRIDVPKIDVGTANAFVFYIFNNQADQFVNVLIPKTATMRRLGETEPRVIDLTVPSTGGKVPLMFYPHFDASSQK
jgi:hypothetical protein